MFLVIALNFEINEPICRFVVGVETGLKRITESVFNKTPTRMEHIIFSETDFALWGQILEAHSTESPTVEPPKSPIPSFSEVSVY